MEYFVPALIYVLLINLVLFVFISDEPKGKIMPIVCWINRVMLVISIAVGSMLVLVV